jgi:hypothetical protein
MHELTKPVENTRIDAEVLELGEIIAARLWEEKIRALSRDSGTREINEKGLEETISSYIDLIPRLSFNSIRARYQARVKVLDRLIAKIS